MTKQIFEINKPFKISCPERRSWNHFIFHTPVELPGVPCKLVCINVQLFFERISLVNFDLEQFFSLNPLKFPFHSIINDNRPVDDFFNYRQGEIKLHWFVDRWRPNKASDFEILWHFDFLSNKEIVIAKNAKQESIQLKKEKESIDTILLNTSNKTADYCLWLWTGDSNIVIPLIKGIVEIQIEIVKNINFQTSRKESEHI